ncbi:RsmB/NOP family class I SAM-dependent RNA methyltransferase, partial [Cribrihabitans sp. XS_ASV171]
TLALAAHRGVKVFAHDANPARMKDLPDRAGRAGASVSLLDTAGVQAQAPFDLVLIDVPCSGSGSWRRAPAGKWLLTPERLEALTGTQTAILRETAPLVSPGGVLAYATCSMLDCENSGRVRAFLSVEENWLLRFEKGWRVSAGSDGFYTAHLTRKDTAG